LGLPFLHQKLGVLISRKLPLTVRLLRKISPTQIDNSWQSAAEIVESLAEHALLGSTRAEELWQAATDYGGGCGISS